MDDYESKAVRKMRQVKFSEDTPEDIESEWVKENNGWIEVCKYCDRVREGTAMFASLHFNECVSKRK